MRVGRALLAAAVAAEEEDEEEEEEVRAMSRSSSLRPTG